MRHLLLLAVLVGGCDRLAAPEVPEFTPKDAAESAHEYFQATDLEPWDYQGLQYSEAGIEAEFQVEDVVAESVREMSGRDRQLYLKRACDPELLARAGEYPVEILLVDSLGVFAGIATCPNPALD